MRRPPENDAYQLCARFLCCTSSMKVCRSLFQTLFNSAAHEVGLNGLFYAEVAKHVAVHLWGANSPVIA